MKRIAFTLCQLSLIVALVACGSKRSSGSDEEREDAEEQVMSNDEREETNGQKAVDQPIEDGWTFEQAAQFWLAAVLSDEHAALINDHKPWLQPEKLATLTEGYVQVSVPVQQGNPLPRFGTVYRQPETGGFICFTDSACMLPTVMGDTLNAIGTVQCRFCDGLYELSESEGADGPLYVQSRGRGLFTVFGMHRVRQYDDDGNWQWNPLLAPEWWPAVISVYPGGDSLVVSRGLRPVETFVAEQN